MFMKWLISISIIIMLLFDNSLFLTTLIIRWLINFFVIRYILFTFYITFSFISFLSCRNLFFFGIRFTFPTAASILCNFGGSNCRGFSFLLWHSNNVIKFQYIIINI